MRPRKRWLPALALLAVTVAAVVVYWNTHLFYQSRKGGLSAEQKLVLLRRANRLVPFSDLTLAEEGKAHLSLALENPQEIDQAASSLRRAERLFRSALRLNPASSPIHFYYAKTLQYLSFLTVEPLPESLPELWKAARLAGDRSPLAFEIGQMLMDNWPSLNSEQKEFTLKWVKKILPRSNPYQLQTILYLWHMNIKDEILLENILPESSRHFRTYARFLGEMSLSLPVRQKMLARAEELDTNQAVLENDAGRPDACLALLEGIHFYKGFAEKEDITPELIKHRLLKKDAHLRRAKSSLIKTRKLEEAEADLRAYLELESDYHQVLDLESFLKELQLLSDVQAVRQVGDLRTLAFEFHLMFKLHKYTLITSLGSVLQNSVLVLDDARKGYLREIFMIIADAYDKLNFVYEPEDFYRRALEFAPDSWDVLFRLRRYYERMGNATKEAEIKRALEKVLTPPVLSLSGGVIVKGQSRPLRLIFDSERVNLILSFQPPSGEVKPLVTVLFNGRVVWEDYLGDQDIRLALETEPGLNRMELRAVNQSLFPLALMWD